MKDKNPVLLLDALDKRWNDYYAELKSCRHEASKEVVHDLRVATRRLLSVIELLRAIAPHPRLQRLRKSFKDQLNGFEELRDTQVMVVDVSEALENLKEARPFLEHLEKREKRLLRAASKQVQLIKPGNLIKRISALRKSVLKLSESDGSLDHLLLEAADDDFALVLYRIDMLDKSQTATIHRLRIAFRKFRYLNEILHPILLGYPMEILDRMHDFQDSMGAVQDIEMLLSHLDEFVEKKTSFDPDLVRRYFQKCHTEAVSAFFQGMPKVKTFWRASRRAAFPWNRRQRKPIRKAPASTDHEEKAGNEISSITSDQGKAS